MMYQGNDGAPELPAASSPPGRSHGAGDQPPPAPYVLRSNRAGASGPGSRAGDHLKSGQEELQDRRDHSAYADLTSRRAVSDEQRGDLLSIATAVLGAVRRHLWLALAVVLGITTLTTGIVFSLGERYTATTLLAVDQRDLRLLGMETPNPSGALPNVDSEVEIMKSMSVAQDVAAKLNLANDSRFRRDGEANPVSQALGGALSSVKSALRWVISTGAGDGDSSTQIGQADPNALAAQSLQRITAIRRRGLTNVIAIDVTADTPAEAARLANAYAEIYIDGQVNARLRSAERAEAALTKRVTELGEALRRSETQIKAFALAQASQPSDEAVRREIDRVQSKIAEATRDANSQASRVRELESLMSARDYTALGQTLSIPEMIVLDEQRRALEQRLQRPAEGDVRNSELKQRLDLVTSQLQGLANQRIEPIRRQMEASNERLASARKELEQVVQRADPATTVSVQLFRLQQEAASTRQLYQEYLARLKSLAQQRNIVSPDVHVVAAASAPPAKSFPPRTLLVLIGGMAGIGLAVSVAYARDNYPRNIKGAEDLKAASGVPNVGVIPVISKKYRREGIAPEDEILENPMSDYSEAIRRLRVSLDLAASEGYKSLLVTSSHPCVGKSTIALCMARAASESGLKVVLVDCNFRDPSLHNRLGLENHHGLVQLLLSPNLASEPYVISSDPRSTCSVITSGELGEVAPDRPLQSPRLGKLMRELAIKFDLIILDSPSVEATSDPLILVQYVDAVLLVARAGRTAPQSVEHAVDEIARAKSRNLFTALNFAMPPIDFARGNLWRSKR